MSELSKLMRTVERATELGALINVMESVSPTCEVSISPIRGAGEVELWWVDGEKFFTATFKNTQANLHNPKFSHALAQARKAMND